MDGTPKQQDNANKAAKADGGELLSRQMVKAELLGKHTHSSTSGVRVHIYRRDGKYLARARHNRAFFGETLGPNEEEAAIRLRQLLTDLDRGNYIRPSETANRPLRRTPPKLTFAELCDAYLTETRTLRGKDTASDYRSRLAPVLAFAESKSAMRRWPFARDIDRTFAIELRAYLNTYQVSRNGRDGARKRAMSVRQIYNVLTCLRMMLAWARSPEVRYLPSDFVNPLTLEIVGTKPKKDPLRPVLLPIDLRIQMVESMDLWQLTHLCLLWVLPMRPEEVCGLLISDIDWARQHFVFETRFCGRDFTKARTSFHMPIPAQLLPLLQFCIGGRKHGPLLRSRAACAGKKKDLQSVSSDVELEACFQEAVLTASPGEVAAEQDAKRIFRQLLRKIGGCPPDELAKAFKKLLPPSSGGKMPRMYDLRAAVTTDMSRSGMGLLELRYLTGHSIGDILNEYASLDIEGAMQKYGEAISPMLTALANRLAVLTKCDGAILAHVPT